LFKFELEHGKMENIIIIRSLKKQLDQVIVHEQVENGIAITGIWIYGRCNLQWLTFCNLMDFLQNVFYSNAINTL
jgi:hypothetical protein